MIIQATARVTLRPLPRMRGHEVESARVASGFVAWDPGRRYC
jgi:hypothetical protein